MLSVIDSDCCAIHDMYWRRDREEDEMKAAHSMKRADSTAANESEPLLFGVLDSVKSKSHARRDWDFFHA